MTIRDEIVRRVIEAKEQPEEHVSASAPVVAPAHADIWRKAVAGVNERIAHAAEPAVAVEHAAPAAVDSRVMWARVVSKVNARLAQSR